MSELTEAITPQQQARATAPTLPVTHPNRITGTWRRPKGTPLEADHPSVHYTADEDPC